MKNFVILPILVFVQVLGNVWLSRGVSQIGELKAFTPTALLSFLTHTLTNPWVLLGLVFLISNLFLYLTALSKFELSYVLPMLSSEYVLNALLSWLILGESISAIRWAGTLTVAAGVLIVALSETKSPGKKKAKPKQEKAGKNIYFCLLPFSFCFSKIWLAITVMVLADSAGNIFFSRGMKQVGEVKTLQLRQLLEITQRAITNPLLGSGVLCMAIAFFMFIALLSWADLSLVMPMNALGYVVSVLGARYILKEQVTNARLIGTACVCIGVALISLSSKVI